MTEHPTLTWTDDRPGASSDAVHTAVWRSETDNPPPKRVVTADDRTTADVAYRLAYEGAALLWQGDSQNTRQLLQVMSYRTDRKPGRARKESASPIDAFNLHRQAQSRRARTLGMLLIPLDADYIIPLRRAPDMCDACTEVCGTGHAASVVSLCELLGLIGAHEWCRKGVEIPVLDGERIHPHYGVFSPVHGEYIELAANAPLPSKTLAFDIGTDTGVLTAVPAKRGVRHVVGTDQGPCALACTQENLARLGLQAQVDIVDADLPPEGRAPLIVCNPPWLPARPSPPIERAVYDPNSRMLWSLLEGLAAHLEPNGEDWSILSDFAEHLGLRTRDVLLAMIDAADLQVVGREDIKPKHPKASDENDPFYRARVVEVTSLQRLKARQ